MNNSTKDTIILRNYVIIPPVRSEIQLKKGKVYATSIAREDLRTILGLGYFDNAEISVDRDKKTVKFTVVEKPYIKKIVFKGNKQFSEGKLKGEATLKEKDFLEFQNCIRDSLGEERKEPPDPNMHPKKKVMLAKARLRDRIKAKSGQGISLETSVKAICCMGIGLTPLNIGEISVAAISDIMNVYQKKERVFSKFRIF